MATAPPISLTELEKDPRLFLYTSLTAGSSHIITATSRLETILKANKIPFQAIDMATDEKARRLWQRRAGGRKLPGLVKEGYVIGDLAEIEEWNEFGELHENIGPVPAHNTAAPTGGQVGVQIAPPSMFAPQQKGSTSSATTGVYGQTAVPAAKLPEAGFDKTKGIALPGAAEVAAIAAKKIAEKTGISIPASNPAATANTKEEEVKKEEKEADKPEDKKEEATDALSKESTVTSEPESKAAETKPSIPLPERKMSISFAEEPSKSTAAASGVTSPSAAETKELLTSGSSKTAAEAAPILQKEVPKKEAIPEVKEEDEQDEVKETSEKIAELKVEDKATAAPQQDTEKTIESKSEDAPIPEAEPQEKEVAAPQVAETDANVKSASTEEAKTQEQDAKDPASASLSVED